MTAITDKEFYQMSRDVYNYGYKKINQPLGNLENSKIIGSTAPVQTTVGQNFAHPDYTQHGLQASLVKYKDQYIVVSRGTQFSSSTDWNQDVQLNDPQAYKQGSQYHDFYNFVNEMHQEHPDFNPQQAYFTGHSGGGSLSEAGAIVFDGKSVTFAAPNSYFELPLKDRVKATKNLNRRINFKHANDMVPDLPAVMPKIDKAKWMDFSADKHGESSSSKILHRFNLDGHLIASFGGKGGFAKNGKANTISKTLGELKHISGILFSGGILLASLSYVGGWARPLVIKKDNLDYFVSKELHYLKSDLIPQTKRRIGRSTHAIKSLIKGSKASVNYQERQFLKKLKGLGKVASLGSWGNGIASGEKLLVDSTVDAVVQNQLNGVINDLSEIQKANDTILPEMERALGEVVNEFSSMFPIDMSAEIEEVINSNGLRPRQYADVGAIKAVDNTVKKHKRIAKNLMKGVHNTIKDQENTDSEWANKFKL